MKLKNIIFIIVILFLISCNFKVETLGTHNPILNTTTLYKIEYYKTIEHKAFQQEKEPNFIISNKTELKMALEEIKNADNSEPWKGASWNKVKLYFMDTTLVLSTNDKKIRASNSGAFYDLPNDNFIVRNLKK